MAGGLRESGMGVAASCGGDRAGEGLKARGLKMFARWFGKGATLPPEVVEARAELTKLAGQRPPLAMPCEVLQRTLEALFAEPIVAYPPSLSPTAAQEKLAAGLPLL